MKNIEFKMTCCIFGTIFYNSMKAKILLTNANKQTWMKSILQCWSKQRGHIFFSRMSKNRSSSLDAPLLSFVSYRMTAHANIHMTSAIVMMGDEFWDGHELTFPKCHISFGLSVTLRQYVRGYRKDNTRGLCFREMHVKW